MNRRVEWRITWHDPRWGPTTSTKTKTYARRTDVANAAERLRARGCIINIDSRRVHEWEPRPLEQLQGTFRAAPPEAHEPRTLVSVPRGTRGLSGVEWGAHARRFLAEQAHAEQRPRRRR